MGFIILTLFAAWIASAAIRAKKECDRKRAIINHRLNKLEENQEILAQNVLINRRRMDSFEERWTEYTRKADAKIAKIEATQLKFQYALEQAKEDILNLTYRYEQLQKYSKYLETERDNCVYGSANWHKWNNKLMVNDNKVYTVQKQINKAEYTARNAELKLREVA